MRPMKVAVFLEQTIHVGGGYQQSLTAAVLINRLPRDICTPLFITTKSANVNVLREFNIEAQYIPLSIWRYVILELRGVFIRRPAIRLMRRLFGDNWLEGELLRQGVDVVYFTSPSKLACYLERLNYIATVWDLCHRDDPEFPEVRYDRAFERREKMYKSTLTKAIGVLADSKLGKKNIVRRYGVDDDRVYVMPFSPATGIQVSGHYDAKFDDIKSKYGLDVDYIFYPAQYWAHKNHVYLLRGLKILQERYGIVLGAVFTGGNVGDNRAYVEATARELGLEGRVRFAGHVPSGEIGLLYKQAIALVMPTYFGPTNLPPLEAFQLGVPVLYPDKVGLRQQVGDAALLMDLDEPATMAAHLAALTTNHDLRKRLVEKGRRRLGELSDGDRLEILGGIIRRFRLRRICWK